MDEIVLYLVHGGAVFYSIIEYYVEILAFGFCMYAGEIFGKIEQFL